MNEVRWVAGTRYDITRWVEATSLVPLKERTTTFLSSVNAGVFFVAPTLKPLVELRAIGPTLAIAQPAVRPPPAGSTADVQSALARVVSGRTGSLAYSVTQANGSKAEQVARISNSPDALLVFDDGAIWTDERSLVEQAGLRFNPPLPLAKKDMAVGTRWKHVAKFRDKSGVWQGQVDSSVEVVAIEDVAVPWGIARCFRMNEVRWVMGTRYDITRWMEIASLVLVKERSVTVLGGVSTSSFASFLAPTLPPLVELRAFGP